MDDARADGIVAGYAERYDPLILAEEAAAIAGVPKGTVYDWSSQGLLDGFKYKTGRRIRLDRDAFIRFLLAQSTSSSKS